MSKFEIKYVILIRGHTIEYVQVCNSKERVTNRNIKQEETEMKSPLIHNNMLKCPLMNTYILQQMLFVMETL